MTQPGVSQHIHKLEEQLSAQLFIRKGKHIIATEAAKTLYEHAIAILDTLESLPSEIKKDSPYEGEVSIMSPGGVGLLLYERLLHEQRTHPQLSIQFRFAPNTDTERAISQRKADIGIVTLRPTLADITSLKIGNDPLLLVLPSKYKEPTWTAIEQLGFINHPDGELHGTSLLAENYSEFTSISSIKQSGFSNQISLILDPVSLGLGFTVLPKSAVLAYRNQASISAFSLENPVLEPIFLIHNTVAPLTKRAKFISDVIKNKIVDVSESVG